MIPAGWRLGPDHTDTCCGDHESTAVAIDGRTYALIGFGRKGSWPPALYRIRLDDHSYLVTVVCDGPTLVGPTYTDPPPALGWLLIAYGLPLILALMARLMGGVR